MRPSDFTLLFMNGEAKMMTFCGLFLEREGFKVISTDNALDVAEKLSERKVDLLVFDLQAKGENTFELFMRLIEEHPGLPIIVLSDRYRDTVEDLISRGYPITGLVDESVALSDLNEKILEVLNIKREVHLRKLQKAWAV